MLSGLLRKRYLALRETIQQMQHSQELTALNADFLDIQAQFEHILNIDVQDSAVDPRVQAVRTEINKQLRLLATDLMFLQTARQSASTRRQVMGDRLTLLVRYCDKLLQANE